MVLRPFVGPWPIFQFLDLFTPFVGLLGQRISPSQGCCLHRTTQSQNERAETLLHEVGFEPTTPVFGRAKTVHALDRMATVIGINGTTMTKVDFSGRTRKHLLPPCHVDYIGVDYKIDFLQEIKEIRIHCQ
jgi:hypothetical protein